MTILNTEKEDYHVHSLNYSDGLATIDEIVRFAGEIGMKKIVITDHSQAIEELEGFGKKSSRNVIKDRRWENVHNDVEVFFGVEGDLLNDKGDVCLDIQGVEGSFTTLSHHPEVYSGDKKKIALGFIKALERHHAKINMLGHLWLSCKNDELDNIIELANKFNIAIEINCRYLMKGLSLGKDDPRHKSTLEGVRLILSHADRIYVNSDAHTLSELKNLRKEGFNFLKENGFIK